MKKNRNITLSDVAKKAGVSCSAAGKVLNGGSDRIRVGVETRKKILRAAGELNYHANMAASILAGGNSRLIGVLLDSGTCYRYLHLLRMIEQLSAEHNYRILTSFTHNNVENMVENYHHLRRYGVKGVICCCHDYPGEHEKIASSFRDEKGLVFMEKPSLLDLPYVGTSRTKALTGMIAQARKEGFKRFGLVCADNIWYTERTLRAEFKEALLANGMEVKDALIYEYPEEIPYSLQKRCCDTVEKFIKIRKPDFLYVDDALHGAGIALQTAGMKDAPQLFGGDNNPLFSGLGIPSLDPCYEKIAEALLKELDILPGKKNHPPVIEALYRK